MHQVWKHRLYLLVERKYFFFFTNLLFTEIFEVSGFLSFLFLQSQVLTEYVLVSDTSAVTVTVIGIFKDAVTILV
jgi:hypothetical protein